MGYAYTKTGVMHVPKEDYGETHRQDDEMPNELGDFIREWREDKGKTIRELAAEIGISNSTLSDIETGRQDPRMKTLEAIASTMGIDPDYFFMLRSKTTMAAADYDADVQRAINRHPLMNPVRKRDMLAILNEDINGRGEGGARGAPRQPPGPPRPLHPNLPPNVIAAAGDTSDLDLPENRRILEELENDDD